MALNREVRKCLIQVIKLRRDAMRATESDRLSNRAKLARIRLIHRQASALIRDLRRRKP